MSNRIWIIGLIVIIILAAGYVYLEKPELAKSITSLIIEEPKPEIKKIVTKTDVALIADPTGSTYQNYAIPQIDTNFISNLADIIYQTGGGCVWLSYIDNDSKNNSVLYFPVSSPLYKDRKPERNSGETYYEYDRRIKKYATDTKYFTEDSLKNFYNYLLQKEKFLKSCDDLLSRLYVKNSPANQWSDVIGSLNAAFYTLETIRDSSVNKYLVCFSDLQQDTPHLNPSPVLHNIPGDIKFLAVNPVPGSSKMVTQNVIEIDNPERVLEYISNNNR